MATKPTQRLAMFMLLGLCVAGGVAGWLIARDQVPFFRAMAPLVGAATAMSVASILMALARGLGWIVKRPPPPELDVDWRATSRRLNDQVRKNYESMARRAWLIALILSGLLTVPFAFSGDSLYPAVVVGPGLFVFLFLVLKYSAHFFKAFFAPLPGEQPPTDPGVEEGPGRDASA